MRIMILNMAEKFYKNEKFQEFFYPILYIILSIALVVSGLVIFYNRYYEPIYVHGSSMMPTLLGGYTSERVNYGIADKHQRAKQSLKRFDVAITYYPASWNKGDEDTVYKIKRVWGFPGETIRLTHTQFTYSFTVFSSNGLITERYEAPIINKKFNLDGQIENLQVAEFTVNNKTFYTNISNRYRVFEIKLSEENQEYFLMGDNWDSSSDSYTHVSMKDKITYSLIQGKVVCIQGTAIYDYTKSKLVDKKRTKDLYYF